MKARWEHSSVRFRLAAWYAIGGTILLIAFGGTIYLFVANRIAVPLDEQLKEDLAEIRSRLVLRVDGTVDWDGHAVQPGARWAPTDPWFELWDDQDRLVRRFWPFDDTRLERVPTAPVRGRETISVFRVSKEVRLRVLSVPIPVADGEKDWMVRVMAIHEPVGSALGALLLVIGVALPVVVTLLVLIGFFFTRRWLKPLDDMVAEADRITAHGLNRRLPVVNPHDELGRLAAVFNVTLARLEDSFLTLDRFVSDAAHELLTPLTTLRSVGEVGLRAARSAGDYREIVSSMLEETQRLQRLVERLLLLARAEGGSQLVEKTRVELDQLARQCAEDASILAEEKGQHIHVDAMPCALETDALLLRQALQNLVGNAIKYSPPGSMITIKVDQGAMTTSVSVIDDGPGVRADHQARLTDRFFRADDARSGSGGGYGLGLAITKAYMRLLRGSLDYTPGRPHGSNFCLTVPNS